MIDRLFMQPVQMVVGEGRQWTSALDAIMRHLTRKAFEGDIKANRVLLFYREFAEANSSRKPRLTFVDSDYTRAIAKSRSNDDE